MGYIDPRLSKWGTGELMLSAAFLLGPEGTSTSELHGVILSTNRSVLCERQRDLKLIAILGPG